jgi:hypothetical protein
MQAIAAFNKIDLHPNVKLVSLSGLYVLSGTWPGKCAPDGTLYYNKRTK